MKILIVCDVLGKENNGTTIAAMNLIRFLRASGDEVRILCADQDKVGQENTYVVPNIYLGKIVTYILKKNDVNLAKPVKKTIEQAMVGVDIVHVLIPFALGCAAAKIARSKGLPVTASFHCQAENFTSHIFNTMNSKLVNKTVYQIFWNKLYKYVNAVHYPTDFIRKVFEQTVNHNTNSYVISNGVNDRYIKKEVVRAKEFKEKFNILFIGRISKEKSHPILLKAVAKSKYKDNIRLIFAGQGPREKQVLALAKKLDLEPPTMKFYSREDLVTVINSCDLYVHPAEIEIEAISCLEAITCGLVPVISNSKRSATNAFALSDKNLFEYNDPEDLANKIDYWIEHPEEKKLCSAEYLGYTKIFNQDECMKKMRNMLLTYAKEENHTTKKIYYYRDELNEDFADNGIVAKPTPCDYKYVHKNIFYRLFERVLYFVIAKPIAFLLNKIVNRQKFVNRLTVPKRKLKGCFVYANHTLDMGDAYTPNIIFSQKNHIITNSAVISIPGIRTIVGMLGAMPLPSTFQGTKNFLESMETFVNKGHNITIYPEAHIWPYYTKIRNFPCASFNYPVRLNRPVICVTNTQIKFGKKYRLVTYIDGPFYPDQSIEKNYAIEKLRNEVYNTMLYRSSEFKQYEKFKYININDIQEK